MARHMNVEYKLSDYVHHKMIESTSATLLRLVSSLVSGGAITKPSLTLAQCIQQHADGTSSNQTMLGLAVKLHHKHGSSELVKTINKHGSLRWDKGHPRCGHGVHPAPRRHHRYREHWRDAADYPSTEETRVILSATDPPGYTVGALYGAFKAEPTSASDEGPVRRRVAASVRCSQI